MRVDRRQLIAGGAAALGVSLLVSVGRAAPSTRVAGLIARMTLAEKAGQLSCYSDAIRPVGAVFNPVVNPQDAAAQLAAIRAGQVGMIFNGLGVAGARRAQAAALDSRLRIPLAFAADVLHGHTTIFPIPLAEASAFDPVLAEASARMIAREAAASGLHWTFAPMVDLARDQRWGRVAEGAGEDVLLACHYAAARVRGFQGSDLRRPETIAATPKHFVGYGAVTGGMEYGAIELSDATLRETQLPPFAAAFAAGAASTMSAFGTLNGVPLSGDRRVLTGLLRDTLGFAGPVVSDYDADRELVAHGYARDDRDAARIAILAGVDISMQSGLYERWLPDLVTKGDVPLARVDDAVARVLTLKERLGLFDDPMRSLNAGVERRTVGSAAIRSAARMAARRSIVLLKNDGGLLPLARTGQRIALIGPFGADRSQVNGPWSFASTGTNAIDLATGIRTRMGVDARIEVVAGSGIEAPVADGVAAAVAAARAADIVVLAIGEGASMSGEGNSRVDITIPAPQRELAAAVAATGKPIVVVLTHGRALALDGAVAAAPAILATWFLGSEAGHAIADILFGIHEPTGRLPVSFPRATGQQPWSYDRPSVGRPLLPPPAPQDGRAGWRDARDTVLYPFGHGLGYATFATGPTRATIDGATIAVSAEVHNRSNRTGETTVQLYVHDLVASRTQPRRKLVAYRRLTMRGGAADRVHFVIDRAQLAIIGPDGSPMFEPGTFRFWIALSSADGLASDIEVPA
ncbi:glycoside hydrolase family 3 C-terminal domain-containing protein [Roseomonas aeriglobus]|nr:glycoside hydrolase family 3 C-terminal domain-containing protein [Roseomonas aeriglobus]